MLLPTRQFAVPQRKNDNGPRARHPHPNHRRGPNPIVGCRIPQTGAFSSPSWSATNEKPAFCPPRFFFAHGKGSRDLRSQSHPSSRSRSIQRKKVMSRRPVNPSRRLGDNGSLPFSVSTHKKSQTSPLLSVGLVLLGAFLLIGYFYINSGGSASNFEVSMKDAAGGSCTLEVQRAIPALKNAYGDSMSKILHVGPETCTVVPQLLKEKDIEAWGVEPYDLDDVDSGCKSLVRKGIVRVADVKFPLPYKQKSFSLVIVSDALDYLSPKYVNKTLLELTRVSMDGLVVFTGYPGQEKAKASEQSKFGKTAKLRSSSWWLKYFVQTGLEENEAATKKFEQASIKNSYKPNCQIFHLRS